MAKSESSKRNISLKAIALDTGGTMTDSFIIDAEGSFAVGKALTTGKEESIGILNYANCITQTPIAVSLLFTHNCVLAFQLLK